MSRVIAAALLLFGLSTFSFAQRGGMRSSGGGARSFGGGHPAAAYRASPGGFARVSPGFGAHPMRFAATAPTSRSLSPVFRSGLTRPRAMVIRSAPERRGVFTFGHVNNGPGFTTHGFAHGFHHHPFHHYFLYAVPFYYSGAYWDPYYNQYWNPYYSFGPYGYDPNVGAGTYTDLSTQLGNLDTQVQELRDENDSLRSELDDSQRQPAPSPASSTGSVSAPATTLVFNDGHQTEIQNYAIVGQTLWILSDARATKIPLADLDLKQTIKTNEARGVEFLGPSSKQ